MRTDYTDCPYCELEIYIPDIEDGKCSECDEFIGDDF